MPEETSPRYILLAAAPASHGQTLGAAHFRGVGRFANRRYRYREHADGG
jgi:hypothetical protein